MKHLKQFFLGTARCGSLDADGFVLTKGGKQW